jgi:hypothetical protein
VEVLQFFLDCFLGGRPVHLPSPFQGDHHGPPM